MRRFFKDQNGAAVIEFAALAPFVILCLIGVGALGVTFYQRDELDHAMRTAMRASVMAEEHDAATLKAIFEDALAERGFTAETLTVETLQGGGKDFARVSMLWRSSLDIPFVDSNIFVYERSLDVPLY